MIYQRISVTYLLSYYSLSFILPFDRLVIAARRSDKLRQVAERCKLLKTEAQVTMIEADITQKDECRYREN